MIRSRSYFSGFGSSVENHRLWLKAQSIQRVKQATAATQTPAQVEVKSESKPAAAKPQPTSNT